MYVRLSICLSVCLSISLYYFSTGLLYITYAHHCIYVSNIGILGATLEVTEDGVSQANGGDGQTEEDTAVMMITNLQNV